MNRSGFALLAVLWVITALTAVAGVGLAVARVGYETTRNRLADTVSSSGDEADFAR